MKELAMKGKRCLLLLSVIIALFTGFARAEDAREAIASGAKAAVLIERKTGKVLLNHNEDQALPMASTTKVMTALLAMEYGHLDEIVTVSRNAYGVPGTSIYLNLGENITLRDLVHGLMLASGNDAAMAIAEHIGGSVDGFCKLMTARARELGCEKTVFLNPHGLPVAGHQTTAYELALIAREAMKHEEFRRIVSTQRASIPWEGRPYGRILNNKNRLLSEYSGATGIKTGYTRAAGRCLVFGAKRGGLEVIGVVLNCGDWFEEAKRLMDIGFERYEAFTVFEAGETVRVLPVRGGKDDAAYVCVPNGLSAPVLKGWIPELEIDLPESVVAGLEMGAQVGEARLVLEGEVLAAQPLVLAENVAKRDFGFELERVVKNWVLVTRSGE